MIQNFWMEILDVQKSRQYYEKFIVKILAGHNEVSTFKIDKLLSTLDELLPEQIEVLDLSYNTLGPIKQDSFRNFHNLRSLFLDHADMQLQDEYAFVYQLFSNLNLIELLEGDGNNLTRFDVENLLQKVFAVFIYDNLWTCPY